MKIIKKKEIWEVRKCPNIAMTQDSEHVIWELLELLHVIVLLIELNIYSAFPMCPVLY